MFMMYKAKAFDSQYVQQYCRTEIDPNIVTIKYKGSPD